MNAVKHTRVHRFDVWTLLHLRDSNDQFLDQILTCDEERILYNNRKRSAKWPGHHDDANPFQNRNYIKFL